MTSFYLLNLMNQNNPSVPCYILLQGKMEALVCTCDRIPKWGIGRLGKRCR